ncbi:uncharacterized protein TRAVEDRAFT_46945 [Trametes versicolor FP-101664 SS1]|uniref:uncharacterized protein n=1 Tax=Trametes versicolor (strain FP-101664) TaxID=717944 RepID=UPI0004621A38|nr:uncharacterized protein TRAVEDRAFT_46945 [Trametes versicolor FP-101664 SS1]EIW59643.1 hypothetical protein TRAVEDRAFT_46945 [Trametes versicolor FP-101664 SS1]
MPGDNELSEVPPTLAAALLNGRTQLQAGMPFLSADAIAQIDSYMRNLQDITRTELNQRRAISRDLPPELLCMIFEHALSVDRLVIAPDEMIWRGFIPLSKALPTLLQVCKLWRHLLQNFAFPWTFVSDFEPEFAIQHSKQLPVSVLITEQDSQIAPHLPDLGPRLRELFWGPQYTKARKADVLAFPAPQLEVLYLRNFDAHTGAIDQPSLMLFLGEAPKLCRLHLDGYAYLPGNQFTVLTHLCLEDIDLQLKFPAIIRLLRQCPQLKHLAFIGQMPLHPDDPHPHPQHPSGGAEILPRLQRLSFERVSSRFINNITHALRPRRPDFYFQAFQVPTIPGSTILCMCAFPFLATNLLTHLGYFRKSWHSTVGLVAVSRRTSIRIFTERTDLDDDDWDADRDTSWVLTQLSYLPLIAVEEFHFHFLRIRHNQPPVGAREVFARVRLLPRLRGLSVDTNNLAAFLSMLYGNRLVPLGFGAMRWHLHTLRIAVTGYDSEQEPVVRDTFDEMDPHIKEALAIDRVLIQSDIDRSLFSKTLDTLSALSPSVAFGPTAISDAMATVHAPEAHRDCVDPVAHPAWEGAHYEGAFL